MKRVFLLIKKDFRRKWKNPYVIAGFMLIPLLFTLIFGVVFGTSEETQLPRIKVLVVDQDKGLISKFMQSALTQGELKEMMQIELVDMEKDARKRLNEGKASALLLIPEKFSRNVFDRNPTELRLVKNPAEQFLPQIAEEITDTAALLLDALFSVFGDEIGTIRDFSNNTIITDKAVSDISIKVKNRIEGIAKYVFPPVIKLKQETIKIKKKDGKANASLSIQSYILPAITIMFLLFIVNIVFEDLLRERESGTLLRMMASPMNLREFIWSKMLTAALLGMFCTLFLIGLGAVVFNINWGPPLLVFLIVLALNILISGFISVFYTFIRTENQAGSIISSVVIVMSLLGGSMIPVSNFPAPLQMLSRFTVNYWGIQAFFSSMTGASLWNLLPVLAGMTAIGLVLSIISSLILKNNLLRGLVR